MKTFHRKDVRKLTCYLECVIIPIEHKKIVHRCTVSKPLHHLEKLVMNKLRGTRITACDPHDKQEEMERDMMLLKRNKTQKVKKVQSNSDKNQTLIAAVVDLLNPVNHPGVL